jgi:hypothetical protein
VRSSPVRYGGRVFIECTSLAEVHDGTATVSEADRVVEEFG